MLRRIPIRASALVFLAFELALPTRAARAVVPTRTVALSGQRAPGTPDGVSFASFGTPQSVPVVRLDDAGHVAFRANLLQGYGGVTSANDTGVWFESSGAL